MQSEPSSSSRAVATPAPMDLLLLKSSCCCCQKKSSSSFSRVAAAAKMGLLHFFKSCCHCQNGSSSAASPRAAITQVSFLPLLLPQAWLQQKDHCKSSEALSLISLSLSLKSYMWSVLKSFAVFLVIEFSLGLILSFFFNILLSSVSTKKILLLLLLLLLLLVFLSFAIKSCQVFSSVLFLYLFQLNHIY